MTVVETSRTPPALVEQLPIELVFNTVETIVFLALDHMVSSLPPATSKIPLSVKRIVIGFLLVLLNQLLITHFLSTLL